MVVSTDTNAEKNAKYEGQLCNYPAFGKHTFSLSAYDIRFDSELIDELESYITNTGVWYDLENRFIDIRSMNSGAIS